MFRTCLNIFCAKTQQPRCSSVDTRREPILYYSKDQRVPSAAIFSRDRSRACSRALYDEVRVLYVAPHFRTRRRPKRHPVEDDGVVRVLRRAQLPPRVDPRPHTSLLEHLDSGLRPYRPSCSEHKSFGCTFLRFRTLLHLQIGILAVAAVFLVNAALSLTVAEHASLLFKGVPENFNKVEKCLEQKKFKKTKCGFSSNRVVNDMENLF
jgi:hypothetical protein